MSIIAVIMNIIRVKITITSPNDNTRNIVTSVYIYIYICMCIYIYVVNLRNVMKHVLAKVCWVSDGNSLKDPGRNSSIPGSESKPNIIPFGCLA